MHDAWVSIRHSMGQITLIELSSGDCSLSLNITGLIVKQTRKQNSPPLWHPAAFSVRQILTYGPLWQVDDNSHQHRVQISITQSIPLTSPREFLAVLCTLLNSELAEKLDKRSENRFKPKARGKWHRHRSTGRGRSKKCNRHTVFLELVQYWVESL